MSQISVNQRSASDYENVSYHNASGELAVPFEVVEVEAEWEGEEEEEEGGWSNQGGICSEISTILSKTDDELLREDLEEMGLESAYRAFNGATPSVELFAAKFRSGSYQNIILLMGPYASLPPLPDNSKTLDKKRTSNSPPPPPPPPPPAKAPPPTPPASISLPFSLEMEKRLQRWRVMRFESQEAVTEGLTAGASGDVNGGVCEVASDPDDDEATVAAAAADLRVVLHNHYVSYFCEPLLGGLYAALRDEGLASLRDAFNESVYRRNPGLLCEIWRNCWPSSTASSAPASSSPTYATCRPLLSHIFTRLLNEAGVLLRVYTTNIDGLERTAGCPRSKVIELGGTFGSARCIECGKEHMATFMKEKLQKNQRPTCSFKPCKGLIKPDVVFSGASRRVPHTSLVSSDLEACDCIIGIGLSGGVLPTEWSTPDEKSPLRENSSDTLASKKSASSKGSNGSKKPAPKGKRTAPTGANVLSTAKTLLQDVKEDIPRVFLGCGDGHSATGDTNRDLHLHSPNPEDAILQLCVAAGLEKKVREDTASFPFAKRISNKLDHLLRSHESRCVLSSPQEKNGILKSTTIASQADFFPTPLKANQRGGNRGVPKRAFPSAVSNQTVHESPKKREKRPPCGALRGIGAGDLNKTIISAPRSAPQGAKRSASAVNVHKAGGGGGGNHSPNSVKPVSAPSGSTFVTHRRVRFADEMLFDEPMVLSPETSPSIATTLSPQFQGESTFLPSPNSHDLLSTPVLPPLGTPVMTGLEGIEYGFGLNKI